MIRTGSQPRQIERLTRNIRHLARGKLGLIASPEEQPLIDEEARPLEERAFLALVDELSRGIESLAHCLLGVEENWGSSRETFARVLDLATTADSPAQIQLGSYPGPRHLASLLMSVGDALFSCALIRTPPPGDVDRVFWHRWISYRATRLPFVWPNHAEFLRLGFHNPGTSAVLVLPTGAGKTTVSAIKMAAVLAANKRVIFLAPTHALVDQLSDDLQDMFPEELLGDSISIDFDALTSPSASAPRLEVMTPEACLAALCFSPGRFGDVGLLVFDECHMLSPETGKSRRALDSMLCLLAFADRAPQADLLFLSAMLKNGAEFSLWIRDLTGRDCIALDLLWKPSRQARGVVAYDAEELADAQTSALQVQRSLDKQKGRRATDLRKAAQETLRASPHAIWGLQHNWLVSKNTFHVAVHSLLGRTVPLKGKIAQRGKGIRLLPNVNEVAAVIAAEAAKKGLKTIVFVNNKSHTVSTVRQIEKELPQDVHATPEELRRWTALEVELGSLEHSMLNGPASAVPHNASMLRLERDLAQRMYARADGAKVIVATPTLAQGLNLPAHLAILAGDRRADPEQGGRNDLEAHEILNAAARAGRAGHLANGVVLLLPEPLISIIGKQPNSVVAQKLQAVLPEDDRCVEIHDPLEQILDRISAGATDSDVAYTINRMAAFRGGADQTGSQLFDVRRSFAAFIARTRGDSDRFEAQIADLQQAVTVALQGETDPIAAELASRSGAPMNVISSLRARVAQDLGALPNTVLDWIHWVIGWLEDDIAALDTFFGGIAESVNAAASRQRATPLDAGSLRSLLPGIEGWLTGVSLAEIEFALGGSPQGKTQTERACPRARELANTVMYRGFSYVLGLVSAVVGSFDPYSHQDDFDVDVLDNLGAAVRRGFDRPQKVRYALRNRDILSRVQVHERYHADEIEF